MAGLGAGLFADKMSDKEGERTAAPDGFVMFTFMMKVAKVPFGAQYKTDTLWGSFVRFNWKTCYSERLGERPRKK